MRCPIHFHRRRCRLTEKILNMNKIFLSGFILAFALEVLPCSTSAQTAYREIQVQNGGTIRGSVRFSGDPSIVKSLAINRDVQTCGTKKTLPFLALGKNQGVQNAIISLEGITAGKPWKRDPVVVLDQQKCEYVPHVLIVPLGSQLEILNSDTLMHNVHTYELTGELKTLFNIAQPIQGLRTKLTMDKPGYLAATCDAGHPWMSAFIRVAEHPYVAMTDQDGHFVLDNVPPGSYKLTMWHEPVTVAGDMKMENMQQHYLEKPIVITRDATVAAGGSTTVTFDFK